jgi:hypothetical protein
LHDRDLLHDQICIVAAKDHHPASDDYRACTSLVDSGHRHEAIVRDRTPSVATNLAPVDKSAAPPMIPKAGLVVISR